MARINPRRVLLVFILELVIVLFIVVLVLIIFILVIIVLIVFILIVVIVIVSVFVIVHKNHPAFSISFCCLRGDYSLFYIK